MLRQAAILTVISLLLTSVAATSASEPSSDTGERLWYEATSLAPIHLVLPPRFDGTKPHTLVVCLHGYSRSATHFRRVGERLAEAGFLVALLDAPYPSYPINSWSRGWYERGASRPAWQHALFRAASLPIPNRTKVFRLAGGRPTSVSWQCLWIAVGVDAEIERVR